MNINNLAGPMRTLAFRIWRSLAVFIPGGRVQAFGQGTGQTESREAATRSHHRSASLEFSSCPPIVPDGSLATPPDREHTP